MTIKNKKIKIEAYLKTLISLSYMCVITTFPGLEFQRKPVQNQLKQRFYKRFILILTAFLHKNTKEIRSLKQSWGVRVYVVL